MKRVFSLLLVLCLLAGAVPQIGIVARAASYNASAALSYAAAHWDDGVGLCAQFASECIKRGGSSCYSASGSALYSQLCGSGEGTAYDIWLNSDMSVSMNNYFGKLAAGDVVFYHCSNPRESRPYVHTVICNGADSNGYMRVYAHNNARDGKSKYYYSRTCYDCGYPIDKAVAFHFNGNSGGDQPTEKPEITLNETGAQNVTDVSARIIAKMNNWWGSGRSKMSEMGNSLWASNGELYKTYSTSISASANGGWYAYLDYTQSLLLPQEKYTCQAYGVANGYKFYSDKFSFTTGHADLGSDFYAKISVSGSLYLTTDSNRNVSVQKNDNSKYQIWHFVRLSDGSYQIRAVYDESVVLDVQNAGSSTGTKVNVSPQWGSFNQNKAQEWFLGKQGNGYALRPKCAHKALDVTKGPGVGGKLQLYDSNNTAAQIFYITKTSKPAEEPKETTYRLVFDACGGSPTPAALSKTDTLSVKKFTIPNVVPKKNGYTFLGWSLMKSETYKKFYQPGDSIELGFEMTYLYARWEKEESITLSYSTGTFTAIPSQKKTFPAQSGFEELSYPNEATFTISSVRPSKEGYTFLGWSKSSSASSASYQPGGSITIRSDTILYAVWEKNETTYTLTFDTQGGSSIAPLTITDDQEVKAFVIPAESPEKEGYKFLGWNLYPEATGGYTWPGNTIRINGNTTLYAIWVKTNGTGETPEEPDQEKPDGDITINIYIINFGDVSPDAYYAEAVGWAVQNAITSGTSDKTFSPNASCTRAQAVTFLWRAAGSPEPASTENPFTDVNADDYYYKAVLWAVENGVTSGTSATTFSPNAKCTRAQIVTFLWRAAGSPQVGSTASFGDVSTDAYYSDAVEWAVDGGVTSGTSATTFSPNASCARGQIVTFLYRYAG